MLIFFNPFSVYRNIRKRLLLKRLKAVGGNFVFDPLSTFLDPHLISIGNNVFIGEHAHFAAELKIGNNVMFGPSPIIVGGDHYFGVEGKSVRFLHPLDRENCIPVSIEDEVWCGARVTILSGVTIGIGAVIGAGSLVVKSIPPFTVAVGNSCHPIKKIFTNEILLNHMIALKYSREFALSIIDRREKELVTWNACNLPCINKTSEYWETKT